ncbi:hypothetical protein BJ508DRAFT_325407 [Ascobolus immersus RN42]|uniref:Uncharacterized protein n=1 Tax=Ascobolus immersus RN42 TaxID=1160509 RepID=A0A3N4IAB7_ASCIM|nr:hypothetical protein BJ508DRAFT_325407 [Ascobolus immersus RN42]
MVHARQTGALKAYYKKLALIASQANTNLTLEEQIAAGRAISDAYEEERIYQRIIAQAYPAIGFVRQLGFARSLLQGMNDYGFENEGDKERDAVLLVRLGTAALPNAEAMDAINRGVVLYIRSRAFRLTAIELLPQGATRLEIEQAAEILERFGAMGRPFDPALTNRQNIEAQGRSARYLYDLGHDVIPRATLLEKLERAVVDCNAAGLALHGDD